MAVIRSIHEGFGILYFDTKTYIFGVHPQVTAATAAAATEEFSSTASTGIPYPVRITPHSDVSGRAELDLADPGGLRRDGAPSETIRLLTDQFGKLLRPP